MDIGLHFGEHCAPVSRRRLLPQVQPMLHKCANPVCSQPFRRLAEGKLFQVEMEYFPLAQVELARRRRPRRLRQIDRYWLCDECCGHLTLAFEKGRGVVTVPLSGVGADPPIQPVFAELKRLPPRTRIEGWATSH